MGGCQLTVFFALRVSMESGLEDRNNLHLLSAHHDRTQVSMESGLEDRNNSVIIGAPPWRISGLNGVRPRRPEQSPCNSYHECREKHVSMESGLEDRNNGALRVWLGLLTTVSMESGLEDRNNAP